MEINFQFQHFIDAAVVAENANKGTLQILNNKNDLVLVAQRGFRRGFLRMLECIKPFDASACGRALGTKNTIVITNIEKDLTFKRYVMLARREGVIAVKSIPLLDSDQQCLGVLSVHYMESDAVKNRNAIETILPGLIKLIQSEQIRSIRA